uniref:Uncharacterized protein n=1 Tax=Arundo donax TaxID=35708 RepID=A0A0A8YYA1_ARUDO
MMAKEKPIYRIYDRGLSVNLKAKRIPYHTSTPINTRVPQRTLFPSLSCCQTFLCQTERRNFESKVSLLLQSGVAAASATTDSPGLCAR